MFLSLFQPLIVWMDCCKGLSESIYYLLAPLACIHGVCGQQLVSSQAESAPKASRVDLAASL